MFGDQEEMITFQLPAYEANLLLTMLEYAANDFLGHGCNEFSLLERLPDPEQRRKLAQHMADFKGTQQEYEQEVLEGSLFDDTDEITLIDYLASVIQAQLSEANLNQASPEEQKSA